jgi:homoserine dehydrogenase
MEPLGIALIGCGVVGSGVAQLLLQQSERLAQRAGRPLHLRRIVVLDPQKKRLYPVPRQLLTTDLHEVCDDPSIQVGIEVVGTVEPARQIILQLMQGGKHVVTANKAVLSVHGDELFGAAQRLGRTIAFEASVGGGIPIVHALTQGLAANQILSIKAILNGTSNYILTQMTEQGMSYQTALKAAQDHGYAEPAPTLDVDGTDAAHKLAILARLAFGVSLCGTAIERRGIDGIQLADLRFARELGYVIKLLAEAWGSEGRVALHVEPTLIRKYEPLAEVRGPYNAIHVVGDAVQDTLYYGPGAGQLPTASAVLADVIDIAIGRAQLSSKVSRLETFSSPSRLRSADDIESRFYLRINVRDHLGVLSAIDGVLAQEKVSISSVVQHEASRPDEGPGDPVVIMTHSANLGAVRRAVARINALSCTVAQTVYYPVAE